MAWLARIFSGEQKFGARGSKMTDDGRPTLEDYQEAERTPGYAQKTDAEQERLAVAAMQIRLHRAEAEQSSSAPRVVSLRDHAESADKRAIAELEQGVADAKKHQQSGQLADVIKAIREPFPPIENLAAGALRLALQDVNRARLPALYASAKQALRQCAHIDECTQWASKAEALSSYARQAKDTELKVMADRIQARAIRRCGELLGEIKAARGRRTDLEHRAGAHPTLTRGEAASAAGLSDHQRKQALRIAAVPASEFEAAVEGGRPPSVTALAERGKATRVRVEVTHSEIILPVVYYRPIGTSVEELAIERQVATLMAAWRDACYEARQRFLRNIGVPPPSGP
jgi:hypothetical protein